MRAVLAADPLARVLDVQRAGRPSRVARLGPDQLDTHPVDGRYQPVDTRVVLGTHAGRRHHDPAPRKRPAEDLAPTLSGNAPRVAEMRRRPRPREAPEDEDDLGTGTWVIRADEPQESVEDPFGLQRPVRSRRDADPEGLADSLSDLPGGAGGAHARARLVRCCAAARRSSAAEPRHRRRFAPSALSYPEWDYRAGRYRERGGCRAGSQRRPSAIPAG